MKKEIWKWIVLYRKGQKISFKGYYKVSTFGRIKRTKIVKYKRRTKRKNGRWDYDTIIKKKEILTPGDWEGYSFVSLMTETTRTVVSVHHVVLQTFVGPRPNKKEGCHKNDVRFDNRLSNLYWGTHKENLQDAIKNGKMKNRLRGENNPLVKLSREKIYQIRRLYSTGNFLQKDLAKKFNVHYSFISLVVRNKRRKAA